MKKCKKIKISLSEFKRLYYNKNHSIDTLASMFNVSKQAIHYIVRRYNLKKRRERLIILDE